MLAEATTGISFVYHDANNNPNQAGDYSVWNDPLWLYNPDAAYAVTPIGTSRGQCTQVTDGTDGPGHCSWTLTIHEQDDIGYVKDHKLMVMGDVETLEWTAKQTLAIVGGTERFKGARGTISVVFENDFFVYDIHLN